MAIKKVNVNGEDFELAGGSGGSGSGFTVHRITEEDLKNNCVGLDFSDCINDSTKWISHVFVFGEFDSDSTDSYGLMMFYPFVVVKSGEGYIFALFNAEVGVVQVLLDSDGISIGLELAT